eukprot:2204498-Amphidinium_carterae.1
MPPVVSPGSLTLARSSALPLPLALGGASSSKSLRASHGARALLSAPSAAVPSLWPRALQLSSTCPLSRPGAVSQSSAFHHPAHVSAVVGAAVNAAGSVEASSSAAAHSSSRPNRQSHYLSWLSVAWEVLRSHILALPPPSCNA